ncbi:MAG: immunoglobulin-like domain-containing protein, partial [Nitrososphaerales archaeon]
MKRILFLSLILIVLTLSIGPSSSIRDAYAGTPNIPVITAPTTGTTTNDNTPTISGTTQSTADQIDVYDGGTSGTKICTILKSAFTTSTTWTCDSSVLTNAVHSITATATITGSGGGTSAQSTAVSITIDTTAPTFTIQYYSDSGLTTSLGDNPRLKAGTYYLKITSSEALSGTPTITSNAEGTANDVTNAATVLVSGNNYKYTRTIASNAAAVGTLLEDISITGTDTSSNTATNVNPTNEATKAAYTDTTAPTLSSVTIVSNNANTALAKVGDTATLSFTSSESIQTPSVTMAGRAATVSGSGTSWTASITMASGDTAGAITFSISFSDLTGNAGTAVTTTTNASSVTFDKAAPTPGTLLSPADLAKLNTKPALSWNAATDNVGLATNPYIVKIDDDNLFGSPLVTSAAQATLSYDTTSLSLVSGTTYYWKITVTDAAGNTANSTVRSFTYDTTVPVITRLGSSPVTIQVGSGYTDAGATALDNYDGVLTSSIVTVNPVNTAVIGSYTITYNVSDSSSNAATQVTRIVNVVDTTVPVITRLGSSPVTIQVGSGYTDAGATALDN